MLQFEEFELHALQDRLAPVRTAPEMFPKADAEVVEKHRAWLEDGWIEQGSDKLILAYRSWLIKLPEITILFDLANGEDKPRPHRPDLDRMKTHWLNDMGKAGVGPEDVDLVVCSHLHLDHTGWMTRLVKGAWVPTFPGRRHLASQTELDFWLENIDDYPWQENSLEDTVKPLMDADLISTVDPDAEIAQGVRLVPLPGHSPGMFGLRIDRGGQCCVLAADLAHHPIQMREPHLSTVFDYDPDEAEATRRRFIAQYADSDAVIVLIHFSKPAFRLVSSGGDVDLQFLASPSVPRKTRGGQ